MGEFSVGLSTGVDVMLCNIVIIIYYTSFQFKIQ